MFVKIYKTGYIFHTFSIIIIAAIIWLPSFLGQQTIVENISSSSLFQIYNDTFASNSYINLLSSFFIVIIGGLVVNNLVVANEISGKTSMLGFFFFVLLNMSVGSFLMLNQFLVSSFFILLMVNALFKIPKSEDTIPIAFNASFYLGLAALFYYPSLLLILIIWVALMIFSVSSWREYVVAIIGVSLPLFFTFFWYYLIDLNEPFFANFISAFHFDFRVLSMPIMDLLVAILLLGIIIQSLLKLSGSLMEKGIVLRQKLMFTIWLFMASLLIIIIFEKDSANGVLLSVPSTIVLTNVVSEVKKTRWLDLYISLIFVLILVNYYLVLF